MRMRSIRLVNFKGFEDYRVGFRKSNVLLGANNAGKSTVLSALRVLVAMLPQARRINPTDLGFLDGNATRGWAITATSLDTAAFAAENLRYDFRDDETRIELTFSNGAQIVASWPPGQDEGTPRGMYFVRAPDDGKIQSPRSVAKDLVPSLAVIPTLTPIDDTEAWVSDQTLRRQFVGRRAGRYARNAMLRIKDSGEDEWCRFEEFVLARTPEIAALDVVRRFGNGGDEIDLFFREPGSRSEREIGWAGDGIQIWIQFLLHVWKRDADQVLVLDEPDVYLHPDLQRRVARVALEGERQVVIASHSIEILAEMPPDSAVWVDRSRRRSQRPKGDGVLSVVGRRLGSGFELGVGRALRSPVVLFVEGNDAVLLRTLARVLGYNEVAFGGGYGTVPLGGFSRNELAAAFEEVVSALGGTVRTVVVLDGDLRSAEFRSRDVESLKKSRAMISMWKRREIESYLLTPGALARAARISLSEACLLLEDAIEGMRDEALRALQAQRLSESGQGGGETSGYAPKTVLDRAEGEFQARWSSSEGKLAIVDPKGVIKALNRDLQKRRRSVNAAKLAAASVANETDSEVIEFLEAFSQVLRVRD